MSETTNHPHPATPEAAAPAPPEPGAYRPLSLTAVAGFGLAALYALVVALGALAAFWTGSPLLLPGWTLLVPVAGVALSLWGAARIKSAEGTLAGDRIARWGLLLSLFTGLTYWAYYAATYFAVQQQADAFARDFLDRLIQGKVDSAFVLALRPVDRRPEDANLRNELEVRHNAVGQNGTAGLLTGFHQKDVVRMLSQSDGPPQIHSRGVSHWEYANGGYKVSLNYTIETTRFVFDMALTVQGNESRHKEFEGRQWYVVIEESGISREGDKSMTPEGQEMMGFSGRGLQAAQYWMQLLQTGHHDDAYLMTLLPAERKRVGGGGAKLVGDVGLGYFLLDGLPVGTQGLGASPAALTLQAGLAASYAMLHEYRDLLRSSSLPGGYPAYRKFLDGDLVRAEEGVFWAADKKRREAFIRAARGLFRMGGEDIQATWRLEQITVPIARKVGDRVQVEHDFSLRDMSAGNLLEGRLVLDCAAGISAEEANNPEAWRVVRLDLIRGKSVPLGTAGPEGMAQPRR